MTRLPAAALSEDPFTPDPRGNLTINVFAPGDVRILDRMYDAWCEHGADIGRAQFPALRHEARYRSPASAAVGEPAAVVAWLRLGTAVSRAPHRGGHGGVQGRRPQQTPADSWRSASGLHGHGFSATGYEIARYLALPDVGFERSRGRIHGLALWMPPGTDPVVRLRARDAAFAVRRLTGHGIDVSVAPREDEPRPVAAHPERWSRSAWRWATAFPAIHERRGALDLAEVARWCKHAGLPEPIAFRAARGPLVPGGVDSGAG